MILKLLIATILLLSVAALDAADMVTKLYVPGAPSGSTVGVYGFETGLMITTVSVSGDAAAAFTNVDSTEVWVFSGSSGKCDVINTSTDRIARTIHLGVSVSNVAFTPDGKYCLAVGRQPHGEHLSSVTVIDCNSTAATYQIGGILDPVAVVAAPDSKSFYFISGSGGVLGRVAIPDFTSTRTTMVGLNPVDLLLGSDADFLFVACRGLDGGRRGGSQVSIVDARDDQLYWILGMTDGAPTSLATLPQGSRLFATFDTFGDYASQNLISFDIRNQSGQFQLKRSKGWIVGQNPCCGGIMPGGRYWLGSDAETGDIYTVDLEADSVSRFLALDNHPGPVRVAAVAMDIDARIAEIEKTIAATEDSSAIGDRKLDIAYLLKTGGRDNDMIVAYQSISSDFPETFAAIRAKLGLADIAARNNLVSQSGDYSYNGLLAYARYLYVGGGDRYLTIPQMMTAINRLAGATDQVGVDHLREIAKAYLELSVNRPELAESFYQLGVELHKRDEKKLAQKCFAEVKNQLANITDLDLLSNLKARLDLTTGAASARYRIATRKKEIIVDGLLSEWDSSDPLQFKRDARLSYNSDYYLGPDDLAGSINIERSKERLFIAGVIADDSLVRTPENVGDYVGVYFDLRPSSEDFFTREKEISEGCFLIYINAPGGDSPKASVSLNIPTPYEIASERIPTGYTFEISLPLTFFGSFLPDKRDRFGLGVEIVDFDDASDLSNVNAMGFMVPSSGPGEPLNPELFGYGEFR